MRKEAFIKNGYVIVSNVLIPAEVSELRKIISDQIANIQESGKKSRWPTTKAVFQIPEIYRVATSEKVVSALKEIFGEQYIMMADLHVHKNMCGNWHTDSDSEVPNFYLLDPSYAFAKCGIFLQDNTVEWGGGIDVVPKHHKFPIKLFGARLAHKIKSFYNRSVGTRFFKKRIETKAGDLIIFDCRLPHKSTFPQALYDFRLKLEGNILRNVPPEKDKFSIYWDVCSKRSEAYNFLTNNIKRAKLEAMGLANSYFDEKVHTESTSLHFPESFQPEFVDRVNSLGIIMGCANIISLDQSV